jgi:hypothetical protein
MHAYTDKSHILVHNTEYETGRFCHSQLTSDPGSQLVWVPTPGQLPTKVVLVFRAAQLNSRIYDRGLMILDHPVRSNFQRKINTTYPVHMMLSQ